MVDVTTVVVSVVAVLSAFLQLGVKPQSTIGSYAEDYSCSQLEEELDFQVGENMQLRSEQESTRRMMKTLGNISRSHSKESHLLNLELKNKQQIIETLENVSNAQMEENHRLNLELESKQQLVESLENASNVHMEENQRLKLENERFRLKIQPVTATFIKKLNHSSGSSGITKVEDKIYLLNAYLQTIRVYEDLPAFRFTTGITPSGPRCTNDIIYSNESNCVYISDCNEQCIWVMTTTGEHRLTKWLTNVHRPHTLSLSNEGHLLMLRQSQSLSPDSLEIYSLNATLIRRLHLPQEVKKSLHVVQTSVGNFIILHRLKNATDEPWVISQLTNDGQLIHRFIPRNQSEELNGPSYLSLDSDNNRLFVADYYNNRVILFDSNVLTWSQVFKSEKSGGTYRLFYDASKKHLFVAQYHGNVNVYEII